MDFSDILLTVDYDRTLTGTDAVIPQRNLEAIRYFIDNGGAFTVNTGRSVPMARSIWEQVPVNAPLLLYNGSAAYTPETGELTACHEIPLDLWDTVRACRELLPGLTVELQGVRAHYRFSENPQWDRYCDHNRCPRGLARPGEELGPFLKLALYGDFHDSTVSGMFEATAEERRQMDEAEALLRSRFGEHCEVFRAAVRIIDVHARGVSKARAGRELQEKLGRKLLVCVGDAQNDLSMLREADFAYVPADAALAGQFETVCACGQGAVADVIYRKIPEILKK